MGRKLCWFECMKIAEERCRDRSIHERVDCVYEYLRLCYQYSCEGG